MRYIKIKYILYLLLMVFCLQTQAQEIRTKEQTIAALKYSVKDTFCIYDANNQLDGKYGAFNLSVENEFLIYKMFKWSYSPETGFLVKNGALNFLINFTDTVSLSSTAQKGESLLIRYRNYVFFFFKPTRHYKNSAARRKDEDRADQTAKFFLEAFKTLKSGFDVKEKEEFKLAELKKGKLNTPKPEISEEQRKFIVQANAANEKKDYPSALSLFRKAIEVNPYSYPAAYFNMALIHANSENYYQAAYAMKQYLIISPDAEDARQAQDKIYEWELNIIK